VGRPLALHSSSSKERSPHPAPRRPDERWPRTRRESLRVPFPSPSQVTWGVNVHGVLSRCPRTSSAAPPLAGAAPVHAEVSDQYLVDALTEIVVGVAPCARGQVQRLRDTAALSSKALSVPRAVIRP
jgi:hypothetical protein